MSKEVPEQNTQGAEAIPTPEQFDRRWESLKRYFRRKPVRASIYCVFLICILGGPAFGWFMEHREGDKLGQQLQDLKVAHSSLQTRYDNLETVVAPMIRQAANEFPGEGINKSLKKLVARFEAQPAYSLFLNRVRLGAVNVLLLPKDTISRLTFTVQNIGTAESRDPNISLIMSSRATNFITGEWQVFPAAKLHPNRVDIAADALSFSSSLLGRLSQNRIADFPTLEIKPSPEMIALGISAHIEGDGVPQTRWKLWVIHADEAESNTAVLTNQDAINRLNRLDPQILGSGEAVIQTIWRGSN